MKKFFHWLTSRISKINKAETFSWILAVIVAIFVGVLVIYAVDFVPAINSDYEMLEKQIETITNNPEMIFESDCNINVSDGILTLTLENDECKLITKYDSKLNLLETTKVDKYFPFLLTLLVAILLSVVVCIFSFLIFFFVFSMVKSLWKKIFKTNKHENPNS